MRIPRTTRFWGKHGGRFLLLWAAMLGIGWLGGNGPGRWLTYLAQAAVLVYFALIFVAPFGVGPLGKEMPAAARQDERSSWRD